jgi:hypothetical protein
MLSGKDADGTPSGSGKLSFDIGDLTTSSVAVDYSSPDQVVFKIDSKSTVQLTTDTKLVVSGNASFEPGTHTLAGGASVEVAIDKNVNAKIAQSFATDGSATTSGQVTIKF